MKGIKNTGLIILITIVILAGCVRDPQDIPGDMTQDPVFGISGTFGNDPLSIMAGVDEWTVQPLTIVKNGITYYSSLFSKSGCLTGCVPSLEIGFYSRSLNGGAVADDFAKTIDQGAKSFVKSEGERDSFQIILSTHPSLFMSGNSEWINNVDTTSFYTPTLESTTASNEALNVCFQSFAYTGCHYSQCIYFQPSTLLPCLAYLEPKLISDYYMSIAVRPQGTPPFQIHWSDVGIPGYNIDPAAATIILPIVDSSLVYANVSVTDARGNKTELRQTIRVQNGYIDPCHFPISLSSQQITSASPSDFLDQAEVTFTDETGALWKSTGGIQSLNSTLHIEKVEYFGISPAGEEAYKTAMSFSVLLYNTITGEERNLVVQDAVIPLSHP